MERLNDLGYIPMDHREVRLTFKQPRDITHPDLASASRQIARGDRQLLSEAKRAESETRRVWFFLVFPSEASSSKDGKKVAKVDLLIATPYGAMVLKVLDWSGPCITAPGEKWYETKSDGTKVEHPNQLSDIDASTQWARLFLEKKGVCPPIITSYILFSSPHVQPSFTSDPRIIVGPSACSALVLGNGLGNELAASKTYLEWGQIAVKSVITKLKRTPELHEQVSNSIDETTVWLKFQASLDAQPQFDLLFLRKNACHIFGQFERVEDSSIGEKSGAVQALERFFNRKVARSFRFEHSTSGFIGVPMALISGGLGFEPTCRVRHAERNTESIGYVDVAPQTKLIFRPYGCEGIISPEVNDVESLELARVRRSLGTAEDGSESDVVDQLGNMIGGMLTKSLQAGVKSMLPFPLNAMVQ